MSVSRFLDNFNGDDDDDDQAPRSTNRMPAARVRPTGYKAPSAAPTSYKAPSAAPTPRAKQIPTVQNLKSESNGAGGRRVSLGSIKSLASLNSVGSSDYELTPHKKKEYYPADNYDDRGVTPLMLACRHNRIEEVEKCLRQGYTVEQFDSHARTALFHAASHSSLDIIQLLLKNGANLFIVAAQYERNCLHQACARSVDEAQTIVDFFLEVMGEPAKLEQDKAGILPVHLAINAGNFGLVEELLSTHTEDQLKATTVEFRDCALHLAARKKHIDLVELFVEKGSYVDQQNNEGQTALHIACYEQDIETIRFLGESKAQTNLKDKRNRAPIHLATISGNLKIVKMLTEDFHCDLNMRSGDGSTILHLAAKCGHAAIVNYYISRGVLIQMPNKDGASALHDAARQGHSSVVNVLIAKGASINNVTKDALTPLHIAVNFGKHMVVQVLLGEGAAVNEIGGAKKETPLHLAAKLPRHSEQVVQMLLKSGARVDMLNKDGDNALHIAVRHSNYAVSKMLKAEGINTSHKNEIGETPLHVAVKNLSVAIALDLIDDMKTEMTKEEFITALNSRNLKGETVLHYCGMIQPKMESKQTYIDITKLAIDNYAELNPLTDDNEETPIHYCCHSGNADVIKLILPAMNPKEANKAVNQPNKNGWSPLLIACKGGYTSVVKSLVEYQARIDVFDEEGKNALHISCEHGHLEVAEMLLAKRAYVNAKTKIGKTPVNLAAGNGQNQIIDLLIARYNAAYDIPALNKQVALHAAATNGHLHACQSLLGYGADPMTKDIKGQTPIHTACENDHPQVVQMFLNNNSELGSVTDKVGNNCGHIAASKGSKDVMKMLLKNDPQMITAVNKSTGQLPVHLAAAGGHDELVELLLDSGTTVMDEDKDGNNPMQLATLNGHRAVVEMLKSKIPLSTVSQKNGFSAVHIAAEYDQSLILQDLLSKVSAHTLSECPSGKDPEEFDHGLTPLHLAAKNGHEGTIRILLLADDIVLDSPTTVEGLIPLHMAVIEGKTEASSLILARSAKQIETTDNKGRNALHFAAANGHLNLVQLLLGQGAVINGVDNKKWTPLHYAADAGFMEVCHILVSQDASTTNKDSDEKLPIIYAAKNHHSDCIKFLFMREYAIEDLLADSKFIGDVMDCCKKNDNQSALDFILNSPAPIYTSIQLRCRYQEEASIQKDKSQDFINISKFCEEVTYDLLHLTAPKGTEMVLNSIDPTKKALLDLLIDDEFKECVAHPSVQAYVSELWAGGMKLSPWKENLLILMIFFFPPLWFFLCLPFHRWSRIPTLKFICHIISHTYFILVLSLCIVVPWDRSGLELYPTPWDCVLYIWFLALFLATIVEEDFNGIRLFIAVIATMGIAINIWAIFIDGHDRETLIYARDNVWAFALTALFAQYFQFLAMHEVFGPWTVIIYALILDVLKFLILLFAVILAFTLHMTVIYKPAYHKHQVDLPTTVVNLNVYASFQAIFKDLFFACFGLASIPAEELTAEERNWNPNQTGLIAVVVFALFQIVVITVLVNLLIAMMGNTYAIIDELSEVEWKFGRASLIWNMTKSTSVPMPVNIVTTFVVFFKVIFMSKFLCCTINIMKVYNDMLMYGSLDESGDDDDDDEDREIEPGTKVTIEKVVKWENIKYEYYEMNDKEEVLPWLKTKTIEDNAGEEEA